MKTSFFKLFFTLFLAVTAFSCSGSDDSSDGDQGVPSGEVLILLDYNDPPNANQLSSFNNVFEIPCDFGELDIAQSFASGSDTIDFMDMNIPYEAIITGNPFSLSDTFSDGLGSQLTSAVSLRINEINYVAIGGGFANVVLAQSMDVDGVLVFSITCLLTFESIDGSETRNIRIEVINVGKGSETTC